MRIPYYPGCTLKTRAKSMGEPAVAALGALGVELVEPERWTCCGVVFSLAEDDLIHLLGPVRNLIRIMKSGGSEVVTVCSMCYHTLALANQVMRDQPDKSEAVNRFLEEEPDYHGEVKVEHLLTFLRDSIGWPRLQKEVKRPLNGLKIAPYYGCTLLRPGSVAIEPPGNPRVFGELLEALGASVVEFPFSTECCSSYQIVDNPDIASEVSAKILQSAHEAGAEAVAAACPLCEYNLRRAIKNHRNKHADFIQMPVFYFTQLLAVALGLGPGVCHFELSGNDELPLLKERVGSL